MATDFLLLSSVSWQHSSRICYTVLSYCNMKLRDIFVQPTPILSTGLINLHEELDDVGTTGGINF
jgi:hypothetical protein